MSETGVISTGFNRKRLDAILEQLNSRVRGVIGENANLQPESPDGQINGIVSLTYADLWEIAELAYRAFDVNFVTGASQDSLYAINGLQRLEPTPSRVTLILSGPNDGVLIPAGSLVSDNTSSVSFATEFDAVLQGGQAVVTAIATVDGPNAAAAGTLTDIGTPIPGWTGVVNTDDAVLGTQRESDTDFRARRNRSVARDATAIVDALFAEVSSVNGVMSVRVLENDTNTTDANGVPANSVHVIVIGGDPNEIAQAIYVKKTLGAGTFGTTTLQVRDLQGIDHPIRFSRPNQVLTDVRVDITAVDTFPAQGEDLIAQAIIDYANGDLVQGREFGLGENVIVSELYTAINSIDGITINSVTVGEVGANNQTSGILQIGVGDISVFAPDNISVTIS